MFPLSFLFHLSSTPRDRMRASPDPFSRCARVSPRESPLSAVPVPPRWLKKQTLPRAQKKNERKRLVVDIHLNSQKKNVPPGAKSPCSRRETSKPTKVPRPVRFLRRVSRRRRAFRASRLPACVCEKECCFVCAVMIYGGDVRREKPPFRVLRFVKKNGLKKDQKRCSDRERERDRACV